MADSRLRSGHAALDEVLGGGLAGHGITLIMGLPGSGKTILAQQYAFHNADPERPVVYFSTLSEPMDKIVRYAQTLDFFDASAVGKSVFYEELAQAASNSGLAGVSEQVADTLKQRRPGLVIIDSFKALQPFADGSADYRRFLNQLAGRMTAFPAASLWLGEYAPGDTALLPEFAVADAILDLGTARAGQRDMRYLEVRKLRGSGFRSGQHAYRLSQHGLHLFPRLADVPDRGAYPLDSQRVACGVPALDTMLAGGLWPGAATLITGFGWPASDPAIEIIYRSPVDIYIDEWVYDLLHAIERTGARRVLVDSLLDLQMAAPDETRFREFTYSLSQRLSRQGISLLMTSEVPELFGTRRLSEFAASHLADNVIMLSYYHDQGHVKRALSVIKTRASGHDPSVREFAISPAGITINDTIAALDPPAVSRGNGTDHN